jgi:hypothetical protein
VATLLWNRIYKLQKRFRMTDLPENWLIMFTPLKPEVESKDRMIKYTNKCVHLCEKILETVWSSSLNRVLYLKIFRNLYYLF